MSDRLAQLEASLRRMLERPGAAPRITLTTAGVETIMACLRTGTPVPAPLVERLAHALVDVETEHQVRAHEADTWAYAMHPYAVTGVARKKAQQEGGRNRGAPTPPYQAIANEYWQKHPGASKLDTARWVRRQLIDREIGSRSVSTIRAKIKEK